MFDSNSSFPNQCIVMFTTVVQLNVSKRSVIKITYRTRNLSLEEFEFYQVK